MLRQAEVEHDHVRLFGLRQATRPFLPSCATRTAKTRPFEIIAHELGDLGFVVNNEDGFHK